MQACLKTLDVYYGLVFFYDQGQTNEGTIKLVRSFVFLLVNHLKNLSTEQKFSLSKFFLHYLLLQNRFLLIG